LADPAAEAMQATEPDTSGFRPWTWTVASGHASNDWMIFRARLEAVAARRHFSLQALGAAGDEPLLLLRCDVADQAAPSLLVASGFHGEEPAGPWGVLEFLESAPVELLSAARLSVLPLVNVTGFSKGTRFNAWGENPNRGFLGLAGESPSREGRILLDHQALLVPAAQEGLLTCHEDVLLSHAYLYSQEHAETPGKLTRALLEANAAHFPLHPDGLVDGCAVNGGIVFNHYDGSFESWLMSHGIAYAACVETPGQQPIAQRIAAQRAMIDTFVRAAIGMRT
jgi:hypothetical protein